MNNLSGSEVLGRKTTWEALLSGDTPGFLSTELTSLPLEISVDSVQMVM